MELSTVPPPMDGVDRSEWDALVARGRADGQLHADQIAHVLRDVELTGDVLLVSAPGVAEQTGAVYVYRRTAQGWSESGMLPATGLAAGDGFGGSLAAIGDVALVGAPPVHLGLQVSTAGLELAAQVIGLAPGGVGNSSNVVQFRL